MNYVVGDIHGCFDQLEDELDRIGFNRSVDHLYSTGDLIDRGPYSIRALDYWNTDWFHAVIGNHEDMFIQVMNGKWSWDNYRRNGGDWARDLNDDTVNQFRLAIGALPLSITVNDIGVIHNKIPKDVSFYNAKKYYEEVLWDREWNQWDYVTEGVSSIYIGHTILREPFTSGNYRFIDTGAFVKYWGKKGRLTIEPMVNFANQNG